jgi:hypothetical protein
MNNFIELSLALFWTGYVALIWRLLAVRAHDAAATDTPAQGDASCTTQPMK